MNLYKSKTSTILADASPVVKEIYAALQPSDPTVLQPPDPAVLQPDSPPTSIPAAHSSLWPTGAADAPDKTHRKNIWAGVPAFHCRARLPETPEYNTAPAGKAAQAEPARDKRQPGTDPAEGT